MKKKENEGEQMRQQNDDLMIPENDAILAEITLKHIRQGSYELKAFSEAAERIGSSISACSYRWNCIVREEHEEAINAAKAERIQQRNSVRNKSGSLILMSNR
jgi:prespore-specific regulator